MWNKQRDGKTNGQHEKIMAAPVCKSDPADTYEAMREKSHELTVIIEDGAL